MNQRRLLLFWAFLVSFACPAIPLTAGSPVSSGDDQHLLSYSAKAAANSAPVVTTSPTTTSTNNGIGFSFPVDPQIKVSDSDNPTLASATIKITSNYQAGEDRLFFYRSNSADYGNITAAASSTNDALILTSSGATATLAQWQAALRDVTYQNTATTNPNTTPRVVSFVVNDGTTNSVAATKTLNVYSYDNSPRFFFFVPFPSSVCAGSVLNFSTSLQNVTGPYSYTITNGSNSVTGSDFANGSAYIVKDVTATGSGPQTFTITASGFFTNQTYTTTVSVLVNAIPKAPTVNNLVYCQNQVVNSALPVSTSAGGSLLYYNSASGNSSINVPTLNTTASGVSTYYVSQTVNGCESERAVFTVTVNALPAQYAVSGGGTLCAGGAGAVTLSGSQTGVNYQLLRNGSAVGSPVAGTGSALSFGNQTTAGTYTVLANNPSTTCQQPMSGSAVVSVNSLPAAYTVAGGGAYCAGGTGVPVTLSGSQTGVTYQLLRDGNAVGNPVNGTGSGLNFGNQTTAGTYTVQATNASTFCQQAMSGSTSVTVNPLPTSFTVTGGGAYCIGGSGVAVGLSGSQSGINYQLVRGGSPVGMAMPGTGSALSFGNQTVGGTYTIQATNGSTACQQAMSGSVTVTVNPLPTPAIVGLAAAVCQDATPQSLSTTGNPSGGAFTIDGNPATNFNPASLSIGQHTVVYSYTNSNGCSNTTATPVTVKAVPTAPTLVTISGQPYAAGVSSLTASVNTGSVSLTVSGCSNGTLAWTGGNATTLAVSTANVGPQSFTATCTSNGCTSSMATASVVVVPTTLGVLYRDADYGNLTNNIIKPYLELSNASNDPIPNDQIRVRYWFTSEGNASPTNLAVYYAPMGVTMKYVALPQPRQGAYGYVEYSFSGGSLGAHSMAGPIENGIQKSDGSNFDESDDYSYLANYQDFMPNAHITAYRNGVIFWGQEPAPISAQPAVQLYSAAKDSPITSQIQTRLELRNTGTGPLAVANLKLRYYFSSDNNQPARVYVDYADIGAGNVAARVVQLGTPVTGADSYVELSFPGSSLTVNALSSLGAIDFRLVRSDYGLFDQSNDYSFMANYGNVGLNNNVTAYLGTTRIFGTPPAAGLRAISLEPRSVLQARVLGNPVVGSSAEVEIRGVARQVVTLRLVDLQGRLIHEQRIEQAAETERISVPLGSNRGTLLLTVSTDSQQQRLKLLRP